MEDQIVQADKRLRNKVILGIVVFAVLGVLAIQGLSPFLDQIRQLSGTDPQLANRKLFSLLNTLSVVHALVSVAFATYFLFLGVKTLRGGQYPPDGMRVIRGTKIQVGSRAKAMAYANIFIGLLILSTNAIVWQLRAILEKLAQG